MARSRLSLIAINIVVFLAVAEAAAVGVYYFQHGTFFYTAERAMPGALPETGRGELSADVWHPYFGPIHRPGVRPETNNIGFGSKQPFPFARTSDRQFLIGIFGGSVARAFCDRGTPRLIAALRRDQALAGRDISMPSPIHIDPLLNLIDQATLTPARVQALARISVYKERLNRLTDRMRRNRIAAVHVALDRYYVFTMNRYQAETAAYDALPSNPPASSIVLHAPHLQRRGSACGVERQDAVQAGGRKRLSGAHADSVHAVREGAIPGWHLRIRTRAGSCVRGRLLP